MAKRYNGNPAAEGEAAARRDAWFENHRRQDPHCTCNDCVEYHFAGQAADPQYQILCRVSGGYTGTREALLKRNGEVAYFNSRVEAQAEADRLMREMNGPYATADFRYTVVEADTLFL